MLLLRIQGLLQNVCFIPIVPTEKPNMFTYNIKNLFLSKN